MEEDLKLLLLEAEAPPKEWRVGLRVARSKALNAISSAGAKVRHDSGGRLILVEAREETEKAVTDRLARARFLPLDSDLRDVVPELDDTELLFLEALRIRTSKSYRETKRKRKVGDTPEERDLVSGPDVRHEY